MYLSEVTAKPWSRYCRILALTLPLLVVPLGACHDPPSQPPPPEAVYVNVLRPTNNKVDILFLVDNSSSMEAMARELRNRFNQFFTVFEDLARSGTYADLHIGVVTSDYGAGVGSGACSDGGGGEQGLLQAVGRDAPATCRAPGGNVNYIQYQFGPNGVNNLPAGTRSCLQDSDCPSGTCNTQTQTCTGTLACASDTDCPTGQLCAQGTCIQSLISSFTCMASVGTQGCGYEHVLESARAALVRPENGDFLRSDALLTVVFLTNEDDCSAPPDSDLFMSNATLDAQYGYRSSYRCTRFGLTCNGPLPADQGTNGSLTCAPGGLPSGGKLYDVQRYIDFFTKPRPQGGIKERPSTDVLLVGIDPIPEGPEGSNGLASQIQVLLSDPSTPVGQPYVPCAPFDPSGSPACVPVLEHACQNAQRPEFFGDPAVRLNAVINAAPMHNITSICANDYTAALQGLGSRVVNLIGADCITTALAHPENPDCKVEDVTQIDATQTQVRPIAKCDASETAPCWKLAAKPACQGTSPGGLGLTIVRGGNPVPANTTPRISCVAAE